MSVTATQSWCVVGRRTNPIVPRLLAHLRKKGCDTVHCDPTDGPIKRLCDLECPVETVNLCVNPAAGLKLLSEYVAAGKCSASYVFVQPGAGSDQLARFCEESGLQIHHGCVLLDM